MNISKCIWRFAKICIVAVAAYVHVYTLMKCMRGHMSRLLDVHCCLANDANADRVFFGPFDTSPFVCSPIPVLDSWYIRCCCAAYYPLLSIKKQLNNHELWTNSCCLWPIPTSNTGSPAGPSIRGSGAGSTSAGAKGAKPKVWAVFNAAVARGRAPVGGAERNDGWMMISWILVIIDPLSLTV